MKGNKYKIIVSTLILLFLCAVPAYAFDLLMMYTSKFQLFKGRSTDIDDLILNTLGGLLGFLIYAAIKKTNRFESCH